jgi:hypothetical protein
MSHIELRAVNQLAPADHLELSEDVRVFRVMSVDGDTATVDGRRKVHLRSADGITRLVLVRPGRELVRLVVDDL